MYIYEWESGVANVCMYVYRNDTYIVLYNTIKLYSYQNIRFTLLFLPGPPNTIVKITSPALSELTLHDVRLWLSVVVFSRSTRAAGSAFTSIFRDRCMTSLESTDGMPTGLHLFYFKWRSLYVIV